MRRTILVTLGIGAIVTSAAALGIGAVAGKSPDTITRMEYESAMADIEAGRPAVLARCEGMASVDKEVCRAEAGGEEMVRAADLEQSFRRTHSTAREAQRARIDARYQVARARCGATAGVQRDRCLIAAHTARGRALLDSQAPYERRS
jgi:hypothetical protein